MPAWEFDLHWRQYKRGEWGDARADRRAAALSAVVAHHAGRVRPEAAGVATLWDFVGWIDAPEPKAASAKEVFGSNG